MSRWQIIRAQGSLRRPFLAGSSRIDDPAGLLIMAFSFVAPRRTSLSSTPSPTINPRSTSLPISPSAAMKWSPRLVHPMPSRGAKGSPRPRSACSGEISAERLVGLQRLAICSPPKTVAGTPGGRSATSRGSDASPLGEQFECSPHDVAERPAWQVRLSSPPVEMMVAPGSGGPPGRWRHDRSRWLQQATASASSLAVSERAPLVSSIDTMHAIKRLVSDAPPRAAPQAPPPFRRTTASTAMPVATSGSSRKRPHLSPVASPDGSPTSSAPPWQQRRLP